MRICADPHLTCSMGLHIIFSVLYPLRLSLAKLLIRHHHKISIAFTPRIDVDMVS